MSIRNWAVDERPRERLCRLGAEVLSDAELLAIYLRVGIKGKTAIDLARDLLCHFDGQLGQLANAPLSKLSQVPGIGLAKAAQLKASFELSRRVLAQEMRERDSLASPAAVKDWLRLQLAAQAYESFWVLWLDNQNRLLHAEELFRGTLNQTSVYPREVVKQALARNAAAVILAHNHPSGLAEPSAADKQLTQALQDALKLIDVKVLDHFIVAGQSEPLSFVERGFL